MFFGLLLVLPLTVSAVSNVQELMHIIGAADTLSILSFDQRNEFDRQMRWLPISQIASFCHRSKEHLDRCISYEDETINKAVKMFELDIWLRDIDEEMKEYVNLEMKNVNRHRFGTNELLQHRYDTWRQQLAQCIRYIQQVTDASNIEHHNKMNDALRLIQPDEPVSLLHLNISLFWEQMQAFDCIYTFIKESFSDWFDNQNALELELLSYPLIFDEIVVDEIFHSDVLVMQSARVLSYLETEFSFWTLDSGLWSPNEKERLKLWCQTLRFPLRLVVDEEDLDYVHFSHPTVGPLLKYMTVADKDNTLDTLEVSKLCLQDDITRSMCIRLGKYTDWNLMRLIADHDAKQTLTVYEDTIQKLRLFEPTRSIRETNRRLRQLYQDFSAFFPDTEWPIIVSLWCDIVEPLPPNSTPVTIFDVFHRKLKNNWLAFCKVCDTTWRKWQAQLVHLAHLIQIYQKEVQRLKKKDAIDINMCFQRSLFFTASSLFDLVRKITPERKYEKHFLLSSSYPELLTIIKSKLTPDLIDRASVKYKDNYPAIYNQLDTILNTENISTKHDIREWLKRSKTGTPKTELTLPMNRPKLKSHSFHTTQ